MCSWSLTSHLGQAAAESAQVGEQNISTPTPTSVYVPGTYSLPLIVINASTVVGCGLCLPWNGPQHHSWSCHREASAGCLSRKFQAGALLQVGMQR